MLFFISRSRQCFNLLAEITTSARSFEVSNHGLCIWLGSVFVGVKSNISH